MRSKQMQRLARRPINWLFLGASIFLPLLAGSMAHQGELQSGMEDGWRWGFVDFRSQLESNRSIAVDSGDYPHISAYDIGGGDLKYAYQDAVGWHVEVVDSAGDVGQYASLDLDGAGFPHISYYDADNGDLKVAHRDAAGWHTEIVDSTGDVGQFSSLALDHAGHAHVGYYDAANADLKYAYQDGSGWQVEVVDSSGNVGRHVSLDLDSRGAPQLAYHDRATRFVKLARRDGAGWQIELVDVASGSPGPLLSLAINPQDEALVAYSNWDTGAVYLAHRTAAGWRFETVLLTRAASLSMALNRAGEPRLYCTYGNSGTYAYRDESAWHVVAAPFGSDADFASLAVDNQDRPHLAGVDEFHTIDFSRALVYATTPNYLDTGYWLTQRTGTPNRTFRFVDADHGWATSSNLTDVIYRTGDGGVTWDQIRLGDYWHRYQVSGMVFLDEQEGWVTGSGGLSVWPDWDVFVAHTTDGGRTWAVHSGPFGERTGGGGIWFVDSQNGWVDNSPSLYRTRDGGESWVSLMPANMPQGVLRFVNPSTGFGLFQDENAPPPVLTVLMRTDDGGNSWSAVAPVPEWQRSLWIADDGLTLWAAGSEGRIAHSADGGATWSPVVSLTTEQLNIIAFVDAQRGWAAGNGGALLRTTDGGQSWLLMEIGTEAPITQLALADWQRLWIYVDGLRRSRDAGVAWNLLPNVLGNLLKSVRMGSLTTGWAGGNAGSLLKTDRGGSGWLEQIDTLSNLVTVEAVDNQHAWVLYPQQLHRTTDGGMTWDAVNLAVDQAYDVDFIDRDHGWLVSDTQVLATSDGGVTWTPQQAPSARYLDVDFVDDQHGWIMAKVGTSRVWLVTEDGGVAWTQVGEPRPAIGVGPMDFADLSHGWAIDYAPQSDYSPFLIMRTTDGGVHWQQALQNGQYRSIDFVDALEGWVVDIDGNILYTRDGGVTWSQAQHELHTTFQDVHAPAPGSAWLVGDNGLIVYYSAEEPAGCWATPTPRPPYTGTPPASGSIQRQVGHCMDDAYVRLDTGDFLFDADVVRMGARLDGAAPYAAGFLFRDVRIPRGARISNASLQLEWHYQDGTPVEVTIVGDLQGNAGDFRPNGWQPQLRRRTTARVPWTITSTVSGAVTSPDIAALIQEIVAQPDWQPGNDIAILIDPTATSRRYISWRAFDLSPGQAARLALSYTTSTGPTNTPTATATVTPTATTTSTPTATPAMHYRYLPLVLRG